MRLFKTTYRDRKGQTKEVKKWYIEIRDHQDIPRRFAAFTDQTQSRKLGEKIERLVVCKMLNEVPDRELLTWLSGIPPKLANRLKEIGLLSKQRAAAGEPLTKHLADFDLSLKAMDRTQGHIKNTVRAIRNIFTGCGFRVWSDIGAAEVEQFLFQRREGGLSYGTSNFELRAIKHFAKWMIANGRAEKSPVERLKALNEELDRRRVRRALSVDELRHFLETTRKGPTRGMTGPARALLYRLASETGYRARELRNLKVRNFDLEALTVSQEAQFCKNRKVANQPISPGLAAALKKHLATKTPDTPAFRVPKRTADMIRADLKDAGIEYIVDGKYFDFHSLRVELGTLLYESGTHPRLAQEIMRHADFRLTMKTYSKVKDSQKHRAIANLPNLAKKDTAG